MGSSASKATRRLPTSTPSSTRRAPPTWAQAKPPFDPAKSPSIQQSTSSGRVEGSTIGNEGKEMMGRQMGKAKAEFSGEKDDAVRRDSLDPHFAANLSRLGQVAVNNAGKFVPSTAAAQRTLNSRRDEVTDASVPPPPGHLTAPFLSELLDDLKSASSQADMEELYRRYGMSREVINILGRWVNSPSVGQMDVVGGVDSEEVREMKAVWVDSTGRTESTPQ